MRVEITEKRISDTDPDTQQLHQLHEGDIVSVPDKLGARWCALGWAKDVDGVVPTGERVVGPSSLDVQSKRTKSAAAEV